MRKQKVTFPDDVQTVGGAVKYLREQRGLSLRALAERVGVSAPFLSDVEKNRRSTERLADFAAALEVPVDTLLRFDGRLSKELRDWISSDPALVRFLEDQREKGVQPEDFRAAVLAAVGRKR